MARVVSWGADNSALAGPFANLANTVFSQGGVRILLIVASLALSVCWCLLPVIIQLKERPMLKRDKLEAMLRKITDQQFKTIWKETYGYLPIGDRADLVVDFVAEQYDGELDGCIRRAETLLKPVPRSKLKRRLAPH
jgi:hypothetical protein